MTSASLTHPAFEQTKVHTTTDRLSIVLMPYRVVTFFLLGSLLWKVRLVPLFFAAYLDLKLSDDFFPALFSSPTTLAIFYLTPVILGSIALFIRNKIALRIQSIATLICVFGLCIHQGSYNDVTFVTSLWVSAWCVWYTFRIDDPAEKLLAKAKTFAVLIISLIFLGGAAGKWTPGYWSGDVIYDIYFQGRNFWFFNLLRSTLEADVLREFATYYSRMIVLSETACAFLWLLNPKMGSIIALVMLIGITMFSNVLLFSVTLCLIGLAIVGLQKPKSNAEPLV